MPEIAGKIKVRDAITWDDSWVSSGIQENIPSRKLTVRPWQSSGLVQISFHEQLVIFRVQTVDLPENTIICHYFGC